MTATELRLFRGGCNADGFIEGRFDRNSPHTNAAREQVRAYLSRDWGWKIFGEFSLAKDLLEAEMITRFFRAKLPATVDLIEPLHCAHGLIVFNRILSFPNIPIGHVEKLMSQFNTPGVNQRDQIFGKSYDPYIKERSTD